MLDDNDIKKLIEAQEPVFATKEDIKDFVKKTDFDEFKDKSFSKLDEILSDIKTLNAKKQ